MNEVIESDDPRAKVIGRHRPPVSSYARFDQLQEMVNRSWKGLPFPKGVHRFKTEEEFESWKSHLMMRHSPARRI